MPTLIIIPHDTDLSLPSFSETAAVRERKASSRASNYPSPAKTYEMQVRKTQQLHLTLRDERLARFFRSNAEFCLCFQKMMGRPMV